MTIDEKFNGNENERVPVHSFDLWGTLVVQDVMGPRVMDAYKEVSKGNELDNVVEKNIQNYKGVLKGDKEALKNKKQYVDTLEKPVWDAYMDNKIDINYKGAFYNDTLKAMEKIVDSNEELAILTTGDSPWAKKAVTELNPKVGSKIRKVYSGNKKESQVYIDTANDIYNNGGKLVSHTEDQAKDFGGILKDENLKKQIRTVYVERANHATKDEILSQGINEYTRNLNDVQYTK